MFSLMDKVPSGIEPMLKDLEEHIMSAGLADMVASAETITSVSVAAFHMCNCLIPGFGVVDYYILNVKLKAAMKYKCY